MKHIVFATFGSLGDLYPYVAVGKELRTRGHRVSIATSEVHRPTIEKHGLGFIHVRPDMEELLLEEPNLMRKVMDEKKGSEYVLRHLIMPRVRASYEDLLPSAEDIDLLITHPLTFGAILIARKKNIPWISTVLSPASMWSSHDPPYMPVVKWIPWFRQTFGVGPTSFMMNRIKRHLQPWAEPYRLLQAELGLEVDPRNPFFEGQFAPRKNLALFSAIFAPAQPDWAPNTVATGFPFLSESQSPEIAAKVTQFLQQGAPPIVFTLGSSAIWDSGDFYITSVNAALQLKTRAILLTGDVPEQRLPNPIPDNVLLLDYLPHSFIFPRAAAIVHQGGIGTTARALHSGRPQLVMPYSHDQFDNAHRVKKLGVGTKIFRQSYTADNCSRSLHSILAPGPVAGAKRIAQRLAAEDGAATAATEIESYLANPS